MHGRDGNVPACYAGGGDTAPLRRVVVLLRCMLLPATLFRLRSLDRARRRRLVADRILRTLLRHVLACTVLSFSRHSQHLLGDEGSARSCWQTHAVAAIAFAKERDGSTIGCSGRRVTRWRWCYTALIDGSSLVQQVELVVSRVPLEY